MRSDLALAALASAAVPGMKPVTVAALRSTGPDEEREIQRAVVEDATGRSWVVHAPLTPVAGARLQRHDELVRQLPRHVPFKIPAAAGYAPLGRDGAAVVYPFVEGSPLDLGRLPAGPGLASAVGRALAAVHNIPRGVFEAQDVPAFDAAGVRQRAIAEVDRAAETGRVPTGLLARWEEAFEAAPLWQFATTPIHGSFRGSSLLVSFTDPQDAGSGRVVAVLGWDQAAVGDPAADLADLYTEAGPAAWESVLDSYSLARAQRPDAYLHARARLWSELRVLDGLALAVSEGHEDEVRRAVEALRRMDRLTEQDDSLVPTTARHGRGGEGATAVAAPTAGEASDRADEIADGQPADDVVWHEDVADPDTDLTVEVPVVAPLPGDVDAHEDEDEDEDALPADDDPPAGRASDGLPREDAELREEDSFPEKPLVEQSFTEESLEEEPLVQGSFTEESLEEKTFAEVSLEEAEPDPAAAEEPQAAAAEEPRATEQPVGSELEGLDQEERLHELYGMPDPLVDPESGLSPDATDEGRPTG